MLDIRRIRTDLDGVKADLARKGIDGSEVDAVAVADARQRELAAQRDELRSRVKGLSAEVGRLHKEGRGDEADALRADSRRLGDEEAALAVEVDALAAEVRDRLLAIPNTPHPDAPEGADDKDNPVLRVTGFDPEGYGDHQKVPHWETGAALGILDLERAVKISGSMFAMLRGAGATLSRALCQYALDANADLYEEVRPPTLVTTATLTATGQLPKFADDAYAIPRDDLWAIPTAEAPLTSMAAGEVLAAADLPMRLMAYSPCYRRESGSAGRDTRGLLRVHEFDKVEIFAYATPEQAPAELEAMVTRAEALIAGLGLAHRVIEICAGDQGQAHHRSFDLEVYAPGVDQWLEVSSISWLSDYQARRAAVRYRPDPARRQPSGPGADPARRQPSGPGADPARRQPSGPGAGAKGNELVHTLNGSALAVPRVWAAIVETHRQPDGTVKVPEPLLPYMRGMTSIGA